MRKLQKILILSFCTIIIFSCSVKKDKFLNRKYHAVKARYNILFNGEQAFERGLKKIRDNHQDNFWKRLDIEPVTFNEKEIVGPKFKSTVNSDFEETLQYDTPFDIAEEKATKAIQKHSMNIKGYEKNTQIDDAYFLLGKSRYYTQRFIPAIEAYNYIIANYPGAQLHYKTRVWRAKANIRLGNEQIAIQTINLLLNVVDQKEEIPKRMQEEAHTAMAMAYVETDTIQKVIEHLTKATQTFYNKEQSARNMFILGQIYSELNRKDSARMVFKKLAETSKAPDKYRIHANIELAKNVDEKSTTNDLIKRFQRLAKNSDNRKYLDELYYQLGVFQENKGNLDEAINYYKKSLKAKNGSQYQKTYTYEHLGGIYFKKENYVLSSSYFDSVMKVVPKEFENERRIRRIKRRTKGLLKLKRYEDIVKNNDSILRVVAMTDAERVGFFENHIQKIKKQDQERRQQLLNSQYFGNPFGRGISMKNKANKGKWYFYNSQSKEFGKAEFQRVWGNRPLEDNWRLSDKTTINISRKENEVVLDKIQSKYKLATYLEAIPKEITIKKLKEERNDALYQLGVIYKEQFKNSDLAIKNLERLKRINKNKSIELPIYYHLYQIYESNGNVEKVEDIKNFVVTNYPYSEFTELIKNPNKKVAIKSSEDEVEKKYKELYYAYQRKEYDKVVKEINSFSRIVNNSKLIPKFALLRALSIGKYKSKEKYKKALEFVAFSYSNTDEGKRAQEIINILR